MNEKILDFACKIEHFNNGGMFQRYQSVIITKERALFIQELFDVKFNYEAIAEICKKKWGLLWDLNDQDIRGEKQGLHIGKSLVNTAIEILNK